MAKLKIRLEGPVDVDTNVRVWTYEEFEVA
jgi:hypothetical protein